jgi:uncharacterized protein YndB with AHSA1/START domain
MTQAALKPGIPAPDTRSIVVEEVFPHAPETIWKALTTGALIARWLRMTPTGFAPTAGARFTYQTTPAGAWDGVIRCQVLEATPFERLAYSWRSGHADIAAGYGAPLDTVVTWTLTPAEGGTRLRVVHSGFELPRNQVAFTNMGDGWKRVVQTIDAIAAEQESPL